MLHVVRPRSPPVLSLSSSSYVHEPSAKREKNEKHEEEKKKKDPIEWPILPGYPLPKCHLVNKGWGISVHHARAQAEMYRYRASRKALLVEWGCGSFDDFNYYIHPPSYSAAIQRRARSGTFVNVFGQTWAFFSLFLFLEADDMLIFMMTCKTFALLPYGLDPTTTTNIKDCFSTNHTFQRAWWQRLEVYFYHLPDNKREETTSLSKRLKKQMRIRATLLPAIRMERTCPICRVRSHYTLKTHPILKTVMLCDLCVNEEPAYRILSIHKFTFLPLSNTVKVNPLWKMLSLFPLLHTDTSAMETWIDGTNPVRRYVEHQLVDAGFMLPINDPSHPIWDNSIVIEDEEDEQETEENNE